MERDGRSSASVVRPFAEAGRAAGLDAVETAKDRAPMGLRGLGLEIFLEVAADGGNAEGVGLA